MRQVIDESVEFPITNDSLVEQWGEVELTAPTGDSVPVSEVLDRSGEQEYHSDRMLYMTLVGNLGDAFIGRKYSDERGGAQMYPDPKCSTRRSF